MKNAQVGMKVEAYKGRSVGLLIDSTTWQGEVIKVNKKSIRVKLTESTSKRGRRITSHWENLNIEKTYRFVKTLSDGRDFYRSEADLYGMIVI